MSIKLRRLLRALLVLVCLALIVWSLLTDDGMPEVDPGKARLVTDGEEYARTHNVGAVDATADSIYLNHGSRGIISVYDWDGAYCYSIVTTAVGNGWPELYCCGDRLYLLDKFKHVFVLRAASGSRTTPSNRWSSTTRSGPNCRRSGTG